MCSSLLSFAKQPSFTSPFHGCIQNHANFTSFTKRFDLNLPHRDSDLEAYFIIFIILIHFATLQ